mgnify:FL=1
MSLPAQVKIVEVGARDGLQNEKNDNLTLALREELIRRLAATGLTAIEVGSFVSPKWVPQMADTDQLLGSLGDLTVQKPVLVPNQKGLDAALAAGAQEIAIFGAASEGFSQKNINMSVAESLDKFGHIAQQAIDQGLKVRGYVSTVIACPYDGPTHPEQVLTVAKAMLDMGCYEISLGDTIGVGTPATVTLLLDVLHGALPMDKLAVHFHDTYGQALANILVALQQGVSVVDSSVAGLGGCPYAKGATGNVATEDVVYMLEGMGIKHGVDLPALAATGDWISDQLQRQNQSRAGVALNRRAQ